MNPPKTRSLHLRSASLHNLRLSELDIPLHQLVSISGPSGAGKTTLLKDVIAAEAKRRYGQVLKKLASDLSPQSSRDISGLPFSLLLDVVPPKRSWLPSVASESGMLFPLARFLLELPEECPDCSELLIRQTPEILLASYQSAPPETEVVQIELAIHSIDAYLDFQRKGFSRVSLQGEEFRFEELASAMKRVEEAIEQDACSLILDRLPYHRDSAEQGVREILRSARDYVGFSLSFCFLDAERRSGGREAFYRDLYCPRCHWETAPLQVADLFPAGGTSSCHTCLGAGTLHTFLEERLLDPDMELPLIHGGLAVWRDKKLRPNELVISELFSAHGVSDNASLGSLSESKRQELLFGVRGERRFLLSSLSAKRGIGDFREYGLCGLLRAMYEGTRRLSLRLRISAYLEESPCPHCAGSRLNEALCRRRFSGKTLQQLFLSPLSELEEWLRDLSGSEALARSFHYLSALGLGYVPLSQAVLTLSSGERQRLRLARGLLGDLRGVLYLLDEPMGGLFPGDRPRLLSVLKELVGEGNSIVATGNDREFLMASTSAFALGPGGGASGGCLVSSSRDEIVEALPKIRAEVEEMPDPKGFLRFSGVTLRNLQGLDVQIPLGLLVAVVGPSGSGKSTLVREVIVANLQERLRRGGRTEAFSCRQVEGAELLSAVYDASRVAARVRGRSTLASFSGVLLPIRELFLRLPHSQVTGSLESTRFQGLLLRDILERSIEDSLHIFRHIPPVARILRRLKSLGLGYLVLKQETSTLSEGELQRVYLLRAIPKTLFHDDAPPSLLVCDEPARGLTGGEAVMLAELFRGLCRRGQSVLVVEHNLHFLAEVDYLVELGPGGGPEGGRLLSQGSQKEIREDKASRIAEFLKFSKS